MDSKLRFYTGVVARKYFKPVDVESAGFSCTAYKLCAVDSFNDSGYYESWQDAYKAIEQRLDTYNAKYCNRPDCLKRERGYFQFALLDIFCVFD